MWNGVRDAGVKQNLATLEIRQIRRMLDEGIRVLIFKVVDGKNAYSILREADRQNVPVITLDRLLVSLNVRGHITVGETGLGKQLPNMQSKESVTKGTCSFWRNQPGGNPFGISRWGFTVF